jgi:hypothetical protein
MPVGMKSNSLLEQHRGLGQPDKDRALLPNRHELMNTVTSSGFGMMEWRRFIIVVLSEINRFCIHKMKKQQTPGASGFVNQHQSVYSHKFNDIPLQHAQFAVTRGVHQACYCSWFRRRTKA